MARAIVLGGGMVGRVIAADLLREGGFEGVTLADVSERSLARAPKGAETRQLDLSDAAEVTEAVAPFDLVCGAGPSRLGLSVLRAVIEAGRPYCDISFMPEDALTLDALAKDRGVTAIVDCGVAPGMSNLLAGYAAATFSPCERIDIAVGGIPERRVAPFEYKAGFAPSDVIEEYTRPARQVESGRVVVKEALSEVETYELPEVGTVEAFNTDGLRSLADTLDVPSMTEKTIRWPGHADLMRAFRTAGLFDQSPVDVRNEQGETVRVRPLDVTSALLFPKWTYEADEVDLTVMRVSAVGVQGGARKCSTWNMLDRRNPETGETSMARTTAFPCAIVARMLLDGTFTEPGVYAPERLGREPKIVERVLEELARRGVRFVRTDEALAQP